MAKITVQGAYPAGTPGGPQGLTSTNHIRLDGVAQSLGPFPFQIRSLTVLNQTAGTVTVTDDRGETYIANPNTAVTAPLYDSIRLTAQVSSAQVSGKIVVIAFDYPQAVSTSQLATLAAEGSVVTNCQLQAPQNANIPNNADTTIIWGARTFDTAGMTNLVADPTKITCVTAGNYLIWANWLSQINGGGVRNMSIKKNTLFIPPSRALGSPGDGNIGGTAAWMNAVTLAVGDFLQATVYQDSGIALNILDGTFGALLIG